MDLGLALEVLEAGPLPVAAVAVAHLLPGGEIGELGSELADRPRARNR